MHTANSNFGLISVLGRLTALPYQLTQPGGIILSLPTTIRTVCVCSFVDPEEYAVARLLMIVIALNLFMQLKVNNSFQISQTEGVIPQGGGGRVGHVFMCPQKIRKCQPPHDYGEFPPEMFVLNCPQRSTYTQSTQFCKADPVR